MTTGRMGPSGAKHRMSGSWPRRERRRYRGPETLHVKLAVRQGFEPWIQVLARITV
jgi:hypothetical protein